jgi:hypothetical protein
MAKDKATPVSAEEVTLDPDLLEILQVLVIVIINTVPAEQHAENWKRVSELIDKLRPGQ